MNITFITDCTDDNVRARMSAKIDTLFGEKTTFIGVRSDIEAAGNLVEILNILDGKQGVIFVNVAPRDHVQKKWENGTPFGYFWHQDTLVVASVDGYTLSLVKKFNITSNIKIIEIKNTLPTITQSGMISAEEELAIRNTQFRSLLYVPLAGNYLFENKELPHELYSFDEVKDMPPAIWWIDNFGNTKTTYTKEDVSFADGEMLTTALGTYQAYTSLRAVPDDTLAYTIGSSGWKDTQFIELVAQGVESGSARAKLGLKTGIIQ